MTDHSIATVPGFALSSVAVNNVGSVIGPRAMGTLAPVITESASALQRALRAATRSDHVILDQLILRFDLSRREHYGLFLHLHYSALKNLEPEWRAEDRVDFAAMLQCLISDLKTLKITTPARHPVGRQSLHASDRLGIGYVIRGSRLGATFLRRRVPNQFPTAYLNFIPSLSWSQFLVQLETSTKPPNSNHEHDIIRGARVTFETFVGLFNRALF